MLGPQGLLGGVDEERIADLGDSQHLDVLANRQLEVLGDAPQVAGVLRPGRVLDLQAVRGRHADRDRVQVEHADRVARERRRDEPRLGGPEVERGADVVAIDDQEVLDARVGQRYADADAGRAGADHDGV